MSSQAPESTQPLQKNESEEEQTEKSSPNAEENPLDQQEEVGPEDEHEGDQCQDTGGVYILMNICSFAF